MIYQCPNCSSKFQSATFGLVICPSCNTQVKIESVSVNGCAWDRAVKGGWVDAFIQTIKRALMLPEAFFSEVAGGTGWIRPLIFATIVYMIIFASAAAYQAGFQGLAMSFGIGSQIKNAFIPAMALSIPLYIMVVVLIVIVAIPFGTVFLLLVQSAICHVCLMIVGGASRDFMATFRTACYAASPQVLGLVPLIGGIVAPIWQMVLLVIGLKVVHKTTYGKTLLAVFLPTLLCCGAFILVAIAIAGGVTGALIQH